MKLKVVLSDNYVCECDTLPDDLQALPADDAEAQRRLAEHLLPRLGFNPRAIGTFAGFRFTPAPPAGATVGDVFASEGTFHLLRFNSQVRFVEQNSSLAAAVQRQIEELKRKDEEICALREQLADMRALVKQLTAAASQTPTSSSE